MAVGLVIGTTLSKKNRWNKTSLFVLCNGNLYYYKRTVFQIEKIKRIYSYKIEQNDL
jgi:hypothetical protein